MQIYKKPIVVRMFNVFLLKSKPYLIMLTQLFLAVVGYVLAFCLRFDFNVPRDQMVILLQTLPLLLICRMTAYFLYKLNSGCWRFVGMVDLINISKAVCLGTMLFLIGLVFFYGLGGYSRPIVVIEGVLNLMFLGGIRFGVRWFRETFSKTTPKKLSYVLIAGAGKAGTQLLNEIRLNPHLGMRVVGFIDDDGRKRNAYIQGVQVLGNCRALARIVKSHDIDEVIIAIPSAGFKRISAIMTTVKQCGIKVKVLPNLLDLVQKDGLWAQLRDVPADELLDRPVLRFRRSSDFKMLKNEIQGNNVLITGSGGSIGSELARQAAMLKPKVLVLYERNENDLYFLELELKQRFPKCNLVPVIGDILNRAKFDQTVFRYKVDLIYHAAAYKHVPMMEREPFEAVRNNIMVTRIVAETAVANHVEKCVYISTDKAVKPSSIMGATKRVGEMVMQGFSGNGTKFIMVRFGNVLGSNGSAIQLFKKQIARGGPVTVTDPQVTRYFMSVSEAVQLVMTAGAIGSGGEIFLLDMGKPIKISEMARKLIESSSLVPGKDIEIKYIGLRPGEKLHEELYWKGENTVPTNNKKITMLETNGFCRDALFAQLKLLEEGVRESNSEKLMKVLTALVPEGSFDKTRRNGHERHNGNNGHNGHKLSRNQLQTYTIENKL